MFSSSSANFDPFQYSTIDTPNPNSAPFLNFPFLHGNEEFLLSESLTQHNQHQQISPASESAAQENQEMNPSTSTKAKKKTKTKDLKQQTTPRKRTGKKDRHSKIYTAKGPRDRRMRLSLQIARKFFDLQDMLGFDKASKTIDWLFSKSKSAILEVTNNFSKLKRSESNGERTVSCSSESEVMSGVKLAAEKRINETEILPVSISPAKESRDKARARARERTKEKLKSKRIEKSKEANPRKLEEKNAGAGTCVTNMDKYLGVTDAEKSASILDLSHLNGVNFEDKFSGFPCYSKLSITGNVRVENPNSFFMANPTSSLEHKTNIPNCVYQDQNLTSLLMASDEHNPSFHFMNFSNSTPLFPLSVHFPENHFSSTTPNLPLKYDGSLY